MKIHKFFLAKIIFAKIQDIDFCKMYFFGEKQNFFFSQI